MMAHIDILPAQSQSPTPASATVGVRHQAVARDTNRIVQFGLFHRCVLSVLNVSLHSIRAIGSNPPTVTTGQCFKEAVVISSAWILPAESNMAHHALASCRHAFRKRLR